MAHFSTLLAGEILTINNPLVQLKHLAVVQVIDLDLIIRESHNL